MRCFFELRIPRALWTLVELLSTVFHVAPKADVFHPRIEWTADGHLPGFGKSGFCTGFGCRATFLNASGERPTPSAVAARKVLVSIMVLTAFRRRLPDPGFRGWPGRRPIAGAYRFYPLSARRSMSV